MIKKEVWLKKHYKLGWAISFAFIFLFLLILLSLFQIVGILENSEFEPFFKTDVMEQHSENTYKVTVEINNITIGQKWIDSASFATIQLYDADFNLMENYYTNQSVNFKLNKVGKFYGKITKTVFFTEKNASETRYAWILFEANPNSTESIEFISNYAPKIWKTQPTLKW